MSLRTEWNSITQWDSSVAFELSAVTAILVGIYLWQQVVMEVVSLLTGASPPFGGLAIGGLVPGGLFLIGLVAFTVVYTEYRGITIGLSVPSWTDRWVIGLTAVGPVVLVGLTKLIGVWTGVPYNSLTMSSIATNAPLRPLMLVTGLGLLIGVPTLVVICQGLIQGSFERVVGRNWAVGMTTVIAGFALVSTTGGLVMVPERGKLIGIVLFAIALGIAIVSDKTFTNDFLRYVAVVPVIVIGGLIVVSGVVEVTSFAGALFALSHVAVFGFAAYGYDRSSSLVIPAIAYASLLVANRMVVVLFEAGMQNW